MTTPQPTAPPPAQPPRATTPAVRRRAWGEPHVRIWWVGAVVLCLAAGYLLVSRYMNWLESARLIRSGREIQAAIVEANGSTLKGKTEPGDSWVRVEYTFDGRTYRPVAPSLEGHGLNSPIIVGDVIPIRIDPDNPGRWTPRRTSPPLGQELIGGVITLGAAGFVLLISFWRRSRLLSVWRDGQTLEAVVLSARHTALAPRAWAIRCSPVDRDDRRVFDVFVPSGCPADKGDVIQLLIGKGQRAVAYPWLARRAG